MMAEFRFNEPQALYLLLLLPILLLLFWWNSRQQKRLLDKTIQSSLQSYLLQSVSITKRRLKVWLKVFALLSFIVALARPQSGEGQQKAKSEGLEIVLAVDVSNSMLAEDSRPSRIELARRELSRFVDSLSGDKVGLVAFAGSSILLSPMTGDKAAIKMYLESLSPDAVSTQGTDFRKALLEAQQALERGGLGGDEPSGLTKVIVIASDGEDNEKGGIETAEKIASTGVRIFTLGFGTEQGGQIPMRDERGNLVGFKKDKSGQPVISKSTGEALKAIAQAGQGTFQQVTFGGDAVKLLKQQIDQLQRTELESTEVRLYHELYQYFLFVGILLGLFDFALTERRGARKRWMGRFEVAR